MLPRPGVPLALAAAVPIGVLGMLLAPFKTDLPISVATSLLGPVAAGGTPLWWAMEDVSNVALFVPLGFLLVRWAGPVRGWLLGVAISVGCEAAQQMLPERHASLRDVAMNAIGTAVGIAAAMVLARRAAKRRSGDLHLAAGGAGPVEPAVLGLRDLHAVQAGGAVRHVEPRLVDHAVDLGQGEVLAVVGAAVPAHASMVPHPADNGQVRA